MNMIINLNMKYDPAAKHFFFRVKKKVSLSACAPIQMRARIKLLQLHEFCELRRLNFREGGPCGSKNDLAAKRFTRSSHEMKRLTKHAFCQYGL
jgi:hypothetical protein